MSERIKYQKSILGNLLSGFYEQVELENHDESHRAIFEKLRMDFENEKRRSNRLIQYYKSKRVGEQK